MLLQGGVAGGGGQEAVPEPGGEAAGAGVGAQEGGVEEVGLCVFVCVGVWEEEGVGMFSSR